MVWDKMAPIGSDTIRKCGLVRENMSLQVGFEISYAQAMLSVTHSSLPVDQDVELSDPLPASCLPAFCDTFHYDDNKLNH